jgi:hypothetical protein
MTATPSATKEWESLRICFPQLKGCSLTEFGAWKETELDVFLQSVQDQFRRLYQGAQSPQETKPPPIQLPHSPILPSLEPSPATSNTICVAKEPASRRAPKVKSVSCLSPMPVFRTFTQLYQGMLLIAESAYRDLQLMSAAQRTHDVEAAESLFLKARNDCVRIVAVVQHVVDCKFDVSEFKCSDYKCTSESHHIGPDFTVMPALNEVPLAFKGREWDELVRFQGKPLDGEETDKHTHLDYLCAKAATLENKFHMLLESCAQGIGTYIRGPLKPKLRCSAKVAGDYASNTRDYPQKPASVYLKDILRGTVVCPGVADIRTGLMRLEGSLTGVKDRLQGPTHDVLVNLLFDGLVCEVQFHLAEFYFLKPFLHGPLEVMCAVHYGELLDEEGNLTLHPFEFE